MVIAINNGFEISTYFNNEVIDLVDSYKWSIWMIEVQNYSINTVESFMASMNRFWIYSLYTYPKKNQGFTDYLSGYRRALLNGYEILVKRENEQFDETLYISISGSIPKKKSTINKEIAGINLYFKYTEEYDLITNTKYINYLYEKQKSSHSFLSSIQIKKSNMYLKTFGEKQKYLKPYKIVKTAGDGIKYFPFELFDKLLKISKPREKLIYILCGICSARLGQALNLTLYDLDYDKLDVWLLNPQSDSTNGIFETSRRKWLLEKYHIDTNITNPHNGPDLKFKYPIPLNHNSLYWLDEDKYKKIFFDTLIEYQKSDTYLSELKRFPIHPFLFVTKTGHRLRARSVQKSFSRSLEKLQKYNKKYNLKSLSMHSLRHMFGHAMAEHYVQTGDESLIYVCQNAMGHSSLDSTLVYFKISPESIKNKIKEVSSTLYDLKGN